MHLFSHPEFDRHEKVVFCGDEASGLRAIIAIHSTALGPAAGGCRMQPYKSDAEALTDVLRLSKAMTAKNALAGLPLGGGKSVIIADPSAAAKPDLLRAFADHVQSLGGSYWTAEDVGVGVADVAFLAQRSRYVFGTSAGAGDPSPFTAGGVFQAMRAALLFKFGHIEFKGMKIAIQGLGAVGWELAKILHDEGVDLIVADRDPARVQRAVEDLGAQAVAIDEIHKVPATIFSPCALGGVLSSSNIRELEACIVAGAANNQLEAPQNGIELAKRSILYAPDFIANSGGMLFAAAEILQRGIPDRSCVEIIFKTMLNVFKEARLQCQTPEAMATQLAADRVAAASVPASRLPEEPHLRACPVA